MSRLTYRFAVAADGGSLLHVHRRAVVTVASVQYGDAVAQSWVHGLTAEGYGTAMANGEMFDVAVIEDRIVGFCGVKANEICGLYVDPKHMRCGIASGLLDRALTRLRSDGHQTANVVASLTAVPLYSSHGFCVVGERLNSTRGGLPMTVVDMVVTLQP